MSLNIALSNLLLAAHTKILALPGSGFDGKPNTNWLSPVRKGINHLTGDVKGGILVGMVIMILVGAGMLTFSGRHEHKTREGVRVIRGAVLGTGVALIGVPLALLVLTAISEAFG